MNSCVCIPIKWQLTADPSFFHKGRKVKAGLLTFRSTAMVMLGQFFSIVTCENIKGGGRQDRAGPSCTVRYLIWSNDSQLGHENDI